MPRERKSDKSDKPPLNAMAKDEEANKELEQGGIPEDLQAFLHTIAVPNESDEEAENAAAAQAAQHRRNLKNAKSKVPGHNGSFKGKGKKKPLSKTSSSNEETTGGDSEVDSEEDFDGRRRLVMGIKKRDPDRGRFTEYDIALLYNQFKAIMPNERVNRVQLTGMLKQLFPKCPPKRVDFVVDNFFAVFDRSELGQVSFRELLIAFTLTMKAPMKDKLTWAFRLYDTEGSGEVDRDDLAKMVIQLAESNLKAEDYIKRCALQLKAPSVEEPENHEEKKHEEKKPHTPTGKRLSKRHQSEDLGNVRVLSSKMNERVGATRRNNSGKHKKTPPKTQSSHELKEEEQKGDKAEDEFTVFNELARQRATEVVRTLDLDRNGYVTEEEFVTGCLEDGEFFSLISCFDGAIVLWADLMEKT